MKKFDFRVFFEKYKIFIWVLLSLVVVYLILNKVIGKMKLPKAPNNTVDSPIKKEDTNGTVVSESQAYSYAERLWDAMSRPGTDESTIFEVLQGLSTADYNAVYNAFGLRRYSTIFGESTVAPFGVEMSLSQWLVNELSGTEMRKLKELNKNLPL